MRERLRIVVESASTMSSLSTPLMGASPRNKFLVEVLPIHHSTEQLNWVLRKLTL